MSVPATKDDIARLAASVETLTDAVRGMALIMKDIPGYDDWQEQIRAMLTDVARDLESFRS